MAAIQFFTRSLTRCPCKKAATTEVLATGNVSYGKFCEPCAKRKVKELTKYWEKQTPEAQTQQLRDQF